MLCDSGKKQAPCYGVPLFALVAIRGFPRIPLHGDDFLHPPARRAKTASVQRRMLKSAIEPANDNWRYSVALKSTPGPVLLNQTTILSGFTWDMSIATLHRFGEAD